MPPPDARLEIWYPSMDEVSVFTEVPGDGFDREVTEAKLFAAFAAAMIRRLGRGAAKERLCTMLHGLATVGMESVHLGELKIVPATAGKRHKGFEADLWISPKDLRMQVKPTGFGALGRGVGFYAPTATFALLLTLHERQSPAGRFVLTKTAVHIGFLGGEGRLRTRSPGPVAASAVEAALAELDAAGPGDGEGMSGGRGRG